MVAQFIAPDRACLPDGIFEFTTEIIIHKEEPFTVNVFAVMRYILYINGEYVCEGPCRGAADKRYYDTIRTDKFRCGRNTVKVVVMNITDARHFTSAFGGPAPVAMLDAASDSMKIVSDEGWKCTRRTGHALIYHNENANYIPPFEAVTADAPCEELGVRSLGDFDIKNGFMTQYGLPKVYPMAERPIPMIYPGDARVMKCVLQGDGYQIYDAGEYVTAKVEITVPAGAFYRLTYAECSVQDGAKGMRDDPSGEIEGFYDTVKAGAEAYKFETFWFRAFRFIKVEYNNADFDGDIVIKRCNYPVQPSNFECSDETYNIMQRVSVNTMLCCTHEIFVDCPYYEQQQYIMDSAVEAAVFMRMTGDTRLVRKCIAEFAASQQPCGLLTAQYPSTYVQIIPGYSFYWIFLLSSYLDYSADVKFVSGFTGTIDKIFTYFENSASDDELIHGSLYWDFVDAIYSWDNCVPTQKDEANTVYNLCWAAAYLTAADILTKLGKSSRAAEYTEKYNSLCAKIKENCFDNSQCLYRDGSKTATFSAHTVLWSILAGMEKGDGAKKAVARIFDGSLQQCSFAMGFYLFRALEKAGMYNYSLRLLSEWEKMTVLHCTSWCETTAASPRSECHAWSSAPLHEFSSCFLGVKHSFDDVIKIKPFTGDLSFARGHVPTRFGNVFVAWEQSDTCFAINVKSPEGVRKEITLPNGTVNSFYNSDCSVSINYLA
jgi:alpha-L-rhamnosidase